MTSPVDICNLGLSNIGQDALVTSIDPPDGTVEADHCARFYPIARNKVLEMHTWRFATFRASLAPLVLPTEVEGQWAFAYAMPNLTIRPILVLPPRTIDEGKDAVRFEVESLIDGTEVIYTNMRNAVLKHIKEVTDTTKFTPMFITCTGWLLGSYLAGPITKSTARRQDAYNNFLAEYMFATAGDAKARRSDLLRDHVAAWHKGRGFRQGIDSLDSGSFVERFGT